VFAAAPAAVDPLAATLHLRGPVAAVPGQRFIVRRMSPKSVLGGGTFGAPADAAAPAAEAPEVAAVRAAVAAFGVAGPSAEEIAARANVRAERAADILADEAEEQRVWALARPAGYVDAAAAEATVERILDVLRAREAEAPWALGVTSLALSRALGIPEGLIVRILAAAADRERVRARAGYYATLAHEPQLTGEQRAFIDGFTPVDPALPLVPAPFEPLALEIRRSKIPGISNALDTLLATGQLVRVGDHLYRGAQMSEIRRRLEATLRREGRITAAQFRDALGTSRKYVVPLLEHFDSAGITVRDGDVRALRAVSAAARGSR